MSTSYHKVKSVGKVVKPRGQELERIVRRTMAIVSDVVGGTLGPGGQPVLIERQEHDMPPIVTKDGVTVYQHLGFDDSTAQVILESARDAAVRTAAAAGDGTTTATILAEAIVSRTMDYCRANRTVSPQRVVRRLNEVFQKVIEPTLHEKAIKVDFAEPAGQELLYKVARISANGDDALAKAVMDCYKLVGDSGNVTIVEVSGQNGYEVERIEGFPIQNMGYDDSCGKYASKFINDPAHQRIFLEKPIFVVYHGKLTEIQTMTRLMERIGDRWQDPENPSPRHNVVVVACGFSESVVAQLAFNFASQTTINVIPLLVPMSPFGQLPLLEDIAAVTGAKILDPLTSPMDTAEPSDLGEWCKAIEMTRYRTTLLIEDPPVGSEAPPNETWVIDRVSVLEELLKQAASEVEKRDLEERIGKLTGGIARLKVVGSSTGDLRERRDRAEDAICAVRGAINWGCLPGGGWSLMYLAKKLLDLKDPIVTKVLCEALFEPVKRLLMNAGFQESECASIVRPILESFDTPALKTYDVLDQKYVEPVSEGVLDSLPAVLEAIKNSISIAAQLGTLGGTIVFGRDAELERKEARDTAQWLREASDFKSIADDRPY